MRTGGNVEGSAKVALMDSHWRRFTCPSLVALLFFWLLLFFRSFIPPHFIIIVPFHFVFLRSSFFFGRCNALHSPVEAHVRQQHSFFFYFFFFIFFFCHFFFLSFSAVQSEKERRCRADEYEKSFFFSFFIF